VKIVKKTVFYMPIFCGWKEGNNCRHGGFLLAAALDRSVCIKEYLMILAGAFLLTRGSGHIEHVSLEQREVFIIGTI
jgi:hypothetical protein